jgi:hypothetical protein
MTAVIGAFSLEAQKIQNAIDFHANEWEILKNLVYQIINDDRAAS